jgi:hypothetical protein
VYDDYVQKNDHDLQKARSIFEKAKEDLSEAIRRE